MVHHVEQEEFQPVMSHVKNTEEVKLFSITAHLKNDNVDCFTYVKVSFDRLGKCGTG